MKLLGRNISPIIAMIAIQLVWLTVVVFWIYWFLGTHREFIELAEKYRPELLEKSANWLVMVEGIVMLLIILVGVYVIFLYWNRQSTLYLQQRNIISQVTHELKSPLASIQLHLETIRLRNPPAEKLDGFVNTMLEDTERLHYLINNLLMAARLEQRRKPQERRVTDLSRLVGEHVERIRGTLPEGGSISYEAPPSLQAVIDPEEIGIALRNLFENAMVYSPESADIAVRLARKGALLELSIQDQGRGLAKSELKKVFQRFYRALSPGESVRGTGLGLYIVHSIIRGHGGSIAAESPGPGRGCTFKITIPAA